MNKYKFIGILLLVPSLIPGLSSGMTLDEAIDVGLKRSLRQIAPRIARSRVEGQVREAWSNALPQVDALGSYSRTFESSVIFFPMDSGKVAKIETQQKNTGYSEIALTQPIYTFGRIDAGLNAAYMTRRSTDHQAVRTEKALQLDIMRRFWSVLLLDDVIAVRHEALAVAEAALDRVTRLRDVGMLSDFDVLRARSQVSSLVPEVQQAGNDRRLALLALLETLGLPLDTLITLEGDLDNYRSEVGSDTTLAEALARDDLDAMRDGVRAYQEIYNIYRTAGMPSIGAQMKYSWQWGDDKFKINNLNSASSLSAGLALTVPIWNSGRVAGKAEQIRADLRQMQLDLTMAERGVELQLASTQSTLRTARLKLESAQVAVNEAAEARRIAEIQLENGQVTPLELQTAQLNETSARLGLANARFDLLVAGAELRLATGQNPFTR